MAATPDDFGLRNPVIQKTFLQTKRATSIVARVTIISLEPQQEKWCTSAVADGVALTNCCTIEVARLTDFAIYSLPQNQRYSLTSVSWLLDTRKWIPMKPRHPCIFLCAKASRSTTSGRVSRDTVLQEIRPRACFETG